MSLLLKWEQWHTCEQSWWFNLPFSKYLWSVYNEPSIGPDTEDNTVDKVLSWSLFRRVENTNTDKDVYMSSILMISTNRNKPRKVTFSKDERVWGFCVKCSANKVLRGQGSNSVGVDVREAELWGNKNQNAQVLKRGWVAWRTSKEAVILGVVGTWASVCLELCQVSSTSSTEVFLVTYSDLLKKGNPCGRWVTQKEVKQKWRQETLRPLK